jgi:hypothetical protein
MSIYDQNFNTIYKELSPPDRRSNSLLAWGRVLVKPLQWLHDLFFSSYVTGNTDDQYDNGNSYVVGDSVQYNHQVYECIADTTGNLPTDETYWMLVQKDFRGSDERIAFNAQLLKFEYILNQWFGTTFVQPIYSPPSNPSDIWIENIFVNDGSFIMFPRDGAPSFMLPSGFNEDFMVPSHDFSIKDFIVHYPIAVIPDNSDEYNQLVNLVNKHKLAGTSPAFQSY